MNKDEAISTIERHLRSVISKVNNMSTGNLAHSKGNTTCILEGIIELYLPYLKDERNENRS